MVRHVESRAKRGIDGQSRALQVVGERLKDLGGGHEHLVGDVLVAELGADPGKCVDDVFQGLEVVVDRRHVLDGCFRGGPVNIDTELRNAHLEVRRSGARGADA